MKNALMKRNYPLKSYIFKPITEPKLRADSLIKVMLVDDNKKDIALLMELLSGIHSTTFKFFPYTHVKDALLHLETQEKPDIITLDCIMPGINGEMALQRFKEFSSLQDVPILIHSSMNHYENITHMNRLGASAFFQKPLDIKAFKTLFFNKYIISGSVNTNNLKKK